MKITTVKTAGGQTTSALRDDGVLVLVSATQDTVTLPHDLFHYVVEGAVGMPEGFWEFVAAGALYKGMRVITGMDDASAQELSTTVRAKETQAFDDAEFFVSAIDVAFVAGLEHDAAAACAHVRRSWPHLTCPPLETVDLPGIRKQIGDLTERWSALAFGHELTLVWPREA